MLIMDFIQKEEYFGVGYNQLALNMVILSTESSFRYGCQHHNKQHIHIHVQSLTHIITVTKHVKETKHHTGQHRYLHVHKYFTTTNPNSETAHSSKCKHLKLCK